MAKPAVILLHGALGNAAQVAPLAPLLSDHLDVHSLDFAGHGAAALPGARFTMDRFADDVAAYMQAHALGPVYLFGYSMGGYVACTLALRDPAPVRGIFTLGTKFYWDPETAARDAGRMDPQKIAAKVPQFAATLAARHPALGWETVLGHTRALLESLGISGGLRPAAVAGLDLPVRVCLGDRDTTTTLTESAEMARAFPQGELEVLPNTPHELERVRLARLAATLLDFCAPPD
jgi:pimeloyl-ACP methyl ester carboxylesterase